jgi:hypothetical protein
MKQIGCLSVVVLLLGASAKADETYLWTGGAPGFSGLITLDSSVSPTGGGTVNDVVSAMITVPLPTVPGGTETSEYTFYFNPQEVTVFTGLFAWNSEEITSMDIGWADPAPFDYPGFGTEFVKDYDADIAGIAEDDSGLWLAAPAAMPEPGSASLFALGVGALGLWRWRRRR